MIYPISSKRAEAPSRLDRLVPRTTTAALRLAAMRIYATTERWGVPNGVDYPFLLLRADKWDDFGYKTMYQAEYHSDLDNEVSLGSVKIMKRGMQGSSKPIPLPSGDITLSDDYCSLGQALSYYERLLDRLSANDLQEYLRRMKDVVLDEQRAEAFREEEAFSVSLLREGGAQRALSDGPDLIRGEELDKSLAFDFETTVGGSKFVAKFQFGDTDEIPSRINAVIGYNGVGKTRLMANLSHVAWRDAAGRKDTAGKHGSLHPVNIAFGRVVSISYSAFDTFDPPRPRNVDGVASRAYVYCGLRDIASGKPSKRLKGPEQIAGELATALERMNTEERWNSLNAALAPLMREPSFQASASTLDFRDEQSVWGPVFDGLSTGHKISLNIVVQLVGQLENKSLVLIDEPESHLHPPLLAALMKGVTEALVETNSFAIVATHSPVVLQEVATRYVQVLRRYGDQTVVERPLMETFGENVGILTRTVFNLDNAESDYEGVLQKLAISHGTSRIDELFPTGLSSQALALVMQYEARAALLDSTSDEDGDFWDV